MEMNIKEDIEEIFQNTKELLVDLKNTRVFLTGGTGFFGKWLLEYFKYLNEIHDSNIEVIILTRSIEKFTKKYPHINNEKFIFLEGDIKKFQYENVNIDYIIHAASDVGSDINRDKPNQVYGDIVQGMKHILEFAKSSKVKKVLFTSSGAIYGKIENKKYFSEDLQIDLATQTPYGKGKYEAELLGIKAARENEFEFKIARCFAFAGPYIDKNGSFAITNFLKSSKEHNEINISGDGKSVRTFMYPTDLTIWLITILLRGNNSQAYNVGSDEEISIKELAEKIKEIRTTITINIENKENSGIASNVYVPNIEKAKKDLGLVVLNSLSQTLQKMVNNGY